VDSVITQRNARRDEDHPGRTDAADAVDVEDAVDVVDAVDAVDAEAVTTMAAGASSSRKTNERSGSIGPPSYRFK
jgi:hypothetical protein